MKTFLVVEEQNGGCDYTIGCGVKTYTVEAESYEALLEEAREVIHRAEDDFAYDHPLAGALAEVHPEFVRSGVTVYEISKFHSPSIPAFQQIVTERNNAAANVAKEEAERAELERLKVKYG